MDASAIARLRAAAQPAGPPPKPRVHPSVQPLWDMVDASKAKLSSARTGKVALRIARGESVSPAERDALGRASAPALCLADSANASRRRVQLALRAAKDAPARRRILTAERLCALSFAKAAAGCAADTVAPADLYMAALSAAEREYAYRND